MGDRDAWMSFYSMLVLHVSNCGALKSYTAYTSAFSYLSCLSLYVLTMARQINFTYRYCVFVCRSQVRLCAFIDSCWIFVIVYSCMTLCLYTTRYTMCICMFQLLTDKIWYRDRSSKANIEVLWILWHIICCYLLQSYSQFVFILNHLSDSCIKWPRCGTRWTLRTTTIIVYAIIINDI